MSEMDGLGASSNELDNGVSSIILAREKVFVAKEQKRYREQQKRKQRQKRSGELQAREVGVDTPTIVESSGSFMA